MLLLSLLSLMLRGRGQKDPSQLICIHVSAGCELDNFRSAFLSVLLIAIVVPAPAVIVPNILAQWVTFNGIFLSGQYYQNFTTIFN